MDEKKEGARANESPRVPASKKGRASLFSKLYSDRKRVIDLYGTLHGGDVPEISPEDVEIITLENIILVRRYNDVAFRIKDRLIVLVEHQSTINENMPLRMLLYAADEYEKIIEGMKQNLYKSRRMKLPRPEFYIVYTGDKEWKAGELRLSDAYSGEGDVSLELKVKLVQPGGEPDIQTTLGAYCDFTKYLKSKMKDGKIEAGAIDEYVEQFDGSELFKDFLEKLVREEGIEIINVEYDYEVEKSVIREEGIEEGREEGIRALVEMCKEFKTSFIDTIEKIISKFNLTEEEARAKVQKYWD